MTFAVIPAAGKSARMGRPKLALPYGDRTVLERVIDALRQAGIDRILVVLGPHAALLAAPAQAVGASVLLLSKETPDMRGTVLEGLRWLEENFHPRDNDDWLLVPADHPALDPSCVRQILQARRDHPECSIVVPTYQGKRGHPALIAWEHVAGIKALPAGSGLNVYLRQHIAQTLELPLDSAAVLFDLDTPADYERLLMGGGEQS